jgi:sugar phosphate permease
MALSSDPVTAVLPRASRPERARPTHVRYIVLGLTIGAYMITYIDRVVISSAVPSIQKEFGFSIVTMGWILSSFQWGYALFRYLAAGWAIESARGAR